MQLDKRSQSTLVPKRIIRKAKIYKKVAGIVNQHPAQALVTESDDHIVQYVQEENYAVTS